MLQEPWQNTRLVRTIFLERPPWLGRYRPGDVEIMPPRVRNLGGSRGPQLGMLTCYQPDGTPFGISDTPTCPPGSSPTPPAATTPPPTTTTEPPPPETTVTPPPTTEPITTPTTAKSGVLPTAWIQQQPFFGPAAGIPLVPTGVTPAAPAPAPVPATVPCPPPPTILEEPAVAGIPVVPVTGALLVGAIGYLLLS